MYGWGQAAIPIANHALVYQQPGYQQPYAAHYNFGSVQPTAFSTAQPPLPVNPAPPAQPPAPPPDDKPPLPQEPPPPNVSDLLFLVLLVL